MPITPSTYLAPRVFKATSSSNSQYTDRYIDIERERAVERERMKGYGAQSADTIADDMDSILSQDFFWEDVSNTLRILVATNCHLGYMEKDEIRRQDSFESFDEICSIAEQKKVDFVLLGGNLFHESSPSKSTMVKTIKILRRHCLGDNPVQFQVVRDQTINFANAFGHVNYEDPHFNVGLPIFSIHGNCDGPAGVDNLSAVDILSACNLLNYFGKTDLERFDVEQFTLGPILIRKGSTSIALYGLGNIRDEQFNTMFQTPHAVKWMRPEAQKGCQVSDWFNILVLHQNRVKANMKNAITEHFLPRFLDFVVWGHEHKCLIDPQEVPGMGSHVTQPGSSIATSLIEGESKLKHVLLLEIKGNQYRPTKIPLTSVRPFEYTEVFLKHESDINANDQNSILEHLDKVVKNLIEKSIQKTTVKTENKLPLVRVKVDYSRFMPINPQRFGQKYVGKVANPQDILIFSKASRKACGKIDDSERLRPEELNQQNIEALDAENNLKNSFWSGDSSTNEENSDSSNSQRSGDLESDATDPNSIFNNLQEFAISKLDFPHDMFEGRKVSSSFERNSKNAQAMSEPRQDLGYYNKFFKEIFLLGQGGYGAVFKCQHLIDNKIYAVKKIGFEDIHSATTMHEVIVHSKMDHPNVVRYINSWIEEGCNVPKLQDEFDSGNTTKIYGTHTLYIQMELCDGYLEDLMEKHQESKSTIYKYMIQIYQGVEHMHSKGVIHADISRSNILSSSGVLKIADFGKAKIYEGVPLLVSEEDLGFRLYRAPETFKQEILVDPKIDLYSAGLIYYEFVYLHNAFYRERNETFEAIQSGSFPLPDEVSKLLLSINPENRPTASDAILIFENLLANEIA